MKVKTWFKRVNCVLGEIKFSGQSEITNVQARRAQEDLQLLFELFRPHLEDDMIVAIKDLEHK